MSKSNVKSSSRRILKASSRPLPLNSANAPSTAVTSIATTSLAPSLPLATSKRRSRSASDLRSLLDRALHLRPAQKRTVPQNNSHGHDETSNKPKPSNVKILPWDYKGRFQQLETKYRILLEETQELRANMLMMKTALNEHNELRRHLHNTLQNLKGKIRVCCRVRPAAKVEELDRPVCPMWFPNETTLLIQKGNKGISSTFGNLKHEFNFDKVFGPEANQIEVFEEVSELVQSALDGYHVCVFAYGQTGSGKTFTMQGTDENQGMIPRTIDLIFQKILKHEPTTWTYTVYASFLEIYDERIKDLQDPNSTHNYELRYNEDGGVTVTNLKIVPVASALHFKNLMNEAHWNRVAGATDFNKHSSRSHTIVKIYLQGCNNTTHARCNGSTNLIVLAGSERVEPTTATKSVIESLSTLGSVMLALQNNDRHIRYRDSKLTYLLQSCMGGNSKTLMFVNILPFKDSFGDTIDSLKFASKIKQAKKK